VINLHQEFASLAKQWDKILAKACHQTNGGLLVQSIGLRDVTILRTRFNNMHGRRGASKALGLHH
jgi:hypothetical protein